MLFYVFIQTRARLRRARRTARNLAFSGFYFMEASVHVPGALLDRTLRVIQGRRYRVMSAWCLTGPRGALAPLCAAALCCVLATAVQSAQLPQANKVRNTERPPHGATDYYLTWSEVEDLEEYYEAGFCTSALARVATCKSGCKRKGWGVLVCVLIG